MDNVDVFNGDAQSSGYHLCKGGFVALAVAVRTCEDGHTARGVHANFAAFKQTSTGTQSARHVARG